MMPSLVVSLTPPVKTAVPICLPGGTVILGVLRLDGDLPAVLVRQLDA